VQWADLVRDLSLRTRGQKEVEAIFKTKRKNATKASTGSDSVTTAALAVGGCGYGGENDTDTSDEDDWMHIDDIPEEDETMSDGTAGDNLDSRSAGKAMIAASNLDGTVEDSDWDDAELLE